MPSLNPRPGFLLGASFKEQVGDSAFIVLHAIRVYDIEVSFLPNAPLREAIRIAHGFCSYLEMTEDFVDFAAFIARIPLVLPRGYSIPVSGFMTSPFVDIEYHTFEADYFLYSIKQRPYIHIETGVDLTLSLWAHLCVDAIIEYRKSPVRHPPLSVPLNHERIIQNNGFIVDFPSKSTYNFGNTGIVVFSRHTIPSGNYDTYYELYCDCCRFWEDFLYTEEQQQFSVWFLSNGIRTDSSGRIRYSGTDAQGYPDFPLRNIEPIPQTSEYLDVTTGFMSVNGMLKGWVTNAGTLDIYAPEGDVIDVSIKEPPGLPLLTELLGKSAKLHFNQEWSGTIDGSWKVGYRGLKVL